MFSVTIQGQSSSSLIPMSLCPLNPLGGTHAWNSSTQGVEVGGSLRPAWATEEEKTSRLGNNKSLCMSSEERHWRCWTPISLPKRSTSEAGSAWRPWSIRQWELRMRGRCPHKTPKGSLKHKRWPFQLPNSSLLHTYYPSVAKCSFKSKTNTYSKTMSEKLHWYTGTLDMARFPPVSFAPFSAAAQLHGTPFT